MSVARYVAAIGLVVTMAPATLAAERDSDRIWCATSTLRTPARVEQRDPEPAPPVRVRDVASRPPLGPSFRHALRSWLRSSRCGISEKRELRVAVTFVRGRASSVVVSGGDDPVQRCVARSLRAVRLRAPGVVLVSFRVRGL